MTPVSGVMEALAEGLADGSIESVCVISKGAPCRCGPGFCATERGLGFIGYCGGSRAVAAPDCRFCGAPHQSDAGCWLCLEREGPNEGSKMWLRCLRLNVDGGALLDEQERRGLRVTCDQILDEIEAGTLTLATRQ